MQNTRSIIVFVAVVALGLGAAGVATAAPEPTNRGWSTPVGAAEELDQRPGG